MLLKKFDDFTHIFLVNASQMAYIEEASKTHEMLRKFCDLHRYFIKRGQDSLFGEEVKALHCYLDILSYRYVNRFEVIIENNVKDTDIQIKHLSLLDFMDEIMNNALARHENRFRVTVGITAEDNLSISALLEAEDVTESFGTALTEVKD